MLRAVTLLLSLLPNLTAAQETGSALNDTTRATVERALTQANREGLSLRERINILKDNSVLSDAARNTALSAGRQSLDNARVRDLLGVGDLAADGASVGEERYPSGVFVFASFSMPAPALRQLLIDADNLGVPVVFNGFVDNSAFETETVLRRLFADAPNAHGFMIDPTLFTRFGITAVPSFVTTVVDLDVCDTHGCAGDVLPAHDIVKGNIPLMSALRIIAKGGGDAPLAAQTVLGDKL